MEKKFERRIAIQIEAAQLGEIQDACSISGVAVSSKARELLLTWSREVVAAEGERLRAVRARGRRAA